MIDQILDALAVIATIVTLASGWMLLRIYIKVYSVHAELKDLELPEMFTQMLNRRLIEEHTRELKKFNERKHQ